MTLHTNRHWLIVCLSIFLGILSMNAAAIDPGTVKGSLTYKGKVYSLQHVYAWQPPGQAEELWVYVTDAELPAAAAQDRFEPAKLADEDRFRGVKLIIHPTKADLKSLNMVLYAPGDRSSLQASGGSRWQRLLVGNKRVVGKLQYEDSDKFSLDVEFSAPVFGASGKMQTLSGAQAQKSPQAEVFLVYEKALLTQGIEAAGVYMTPERLADMKDSLKQFGEAGFKEFQTMRLKTTPQGEARRRQIEKVVVDGDNAVLEARSGPNDVDEVRLVKLKNGWKIAE